MSTAIGQKQAVINAVTEVLNSSFLPGSTIVKDVITAEQLETVRTYVYNGIMDGSVTFSKDLSNEKNVRRYVNGMIDNHFRKAFELNGGTKYIAPSGAKSSRDEQLATLNKLLKSYPADSENYKHVASAISERKQFLAKERAGKRATKRLNKVTSFDITKLPPELQGLVGSA